MCLFFLFFCTSSIKNMTIFHGNWTLFKGPKETLGNCSNTFKFGYHPVTSETQNSLNLTKDWLTGYGIFKNSSSFRFDKYRYYYVGFSFPYNILYFFTNSQYNDLRNTDFPQEIENKLSFFNINGSQTAAQVHDILLSEYGSDGDGLTTIRIQIAEKSENKKTFYLPIGMEGKMSFKDFSIHLSADMLNYKMYIIETKVYGLIVSIYIILVFYAWRSISYNISSRNLKKLSFLSYMMYMCFDFNYGYLLLYYSLDYADSTLLFGLLSLVFSLQFYCVQAFRVFQIWVSSGRINGLTNYVSVLKFFLEMLYLILLYLLSVCYIFEFPYLPILAILSAPLPQIFKSAYNDYINGPDNIFIILISLSRILLFGFHYIYPKAPKGLFEPKAFFLVFFYQSFLCIISLLQNRFGGRFFFPRFARPQKYKYDLSIVSPDTECPICMSNIEDNVMITPCGHYFHKACLEQWMNEQMVCPVCRQELPEPDARAINENRNQRTFRLYA